MMAFRDILVVLDGTKRSGTRLEMVAGLAGRRDAHLIGLHISPPVPAAGERGYFEHFDRTLIDPLWQEFETKTRAEAAAAHAKFEKVAKRHALSSEWREGIGYPSEIAALHGRYVDLIVLGQLDPDEVEPRLYHPAPEQVVLTAGRPVLLVPYAGEWTAIGRRVLVGWDASREATRAVNDALPLLRTAEQVTVLAIDPESSGAHHGEIPGADIALHLARHGVRATIERSTSGGIGIGNALLSRASDLAADLLVMGAYGHSRVRELLLGGATRTVLESMTVPVLMSH